MNGSEMAAAFLVLAYSFTSIARLFFYLPQIRSVVRSTDAAAINVPTWAVWSLHNLVSSLYGWFITHDAKFALFFFASGACTTLIASVAAKKQFAFSKVLKEGKCT